MVPEVTQLWSPVWKPQFNRVPEILLLKMTRDRGVLRCQRPTEIGWAAPFSTTEAVAAHGCFPTGSYTRRGKRLLLCFGVPLFWHKRPWSTDKSITTFDNFNVWLLFLIGGLFQLHLPIFITMSCTFFLIFSSRPINSKLLSSSAKSWLIENVSYCIWWYLLPCSNSGCYSGCCEERLYPKSSHTDTVQKSELP